MEKGEMNVVYISLGSNLGNKKANMDKAIELLNSKVGKITKKATYIITEPVDMRNADNFLNTCVELYTTYTPEKILEQLKNIEIELGREINSKGKNESRTIDLDIIFYNQLIINSGELTIPHPRYHLRNFVLIPLIELNNKIFDPTTKLSLKQLIN